ncbi:phosphomannomutase [Enterobacter chuandaensis]|uniref:Phosphomannomutase n=1 Tax=Enterobacter chuandaensis TaxID=2497875 RepID=A0AA96M7A9_9ENTR|nr:phosphomannomutase [Enterobacter chuandaensis]MCW4782445.1 phosphomannomutase [Enterobacter chuandaensis]MDA4761813.1 phosphomannomutase [Enterobacter chuandaensis]WNS40315.1 phosphomannomutase [Enterobacter chuandaensis]
MNQVSNSCDVIAASGIAFGTSGARGLVSDFTPEVCAAFTASFVTVMQQDFVFKTVALAIDNRPSSYAMAQACVAALEDKGISAIFYGVIPTPALALQAMTDRIPAIMITGSHIPFDRNGLKFYRPDGEITKDDELAILKTEATCKKLVLKTLPVSTIAAENYISRYLSLFPTPFLKNKRIGIYEHSSAGRDLYKPLFEALGAEVISLGRSDNFVPIDTEAVSEGDREKAILWAEHYKLDAIFSTDGDGDRPLISDEKGQWLRGDVLGLLCSLALSVEAVAIPVSCNSMISTGHFFKHVKLTKIGSPFVIAAFSELSKSYKNIAGFEANGGFLLGSNILINEQPLAALPTRDAVLPAIMLLYSSRDKSISSLVQQLPCRYTYSDRLQNVSPEKSHKLIAMGIKNQQLLLNTIGLQDEIAVSLDTTDGIRIALDSNSIVHLRSSGNAPELRCYAEANSLESAKHIVKRVLTTVVNT